LDQRRSLRIPVDLPARYRSPTRSMDGRARNLSQDGMLFVGAAPREGVAVEKVIVEIDLPDGKAISVGGEVRWAASRRAGIRFTEIGIATRRRLANLILRTCAMLVG
jgi:hypothetical protein